jgi:hypothetical protein
LIQVAVARQLKNRSSSLAPCTKIGVRRQIRANGPDRLSREALRA